MYEFRWREYENKIYARVLDNGNTGCMVRLEKASGQALYKPGTNDEIVWHILRDASLDIWVDRQAAKKNLETIAEKCKLKLIKER